MQGQECQQQQCQFLGQYSKTHRVTLHVAADTVSVACYVKDVMNSFWTIFDLHDDATDLGWRLEIYATHFTPAS